MFWGLAALAAICLGVTIALARGGWKASMEESTARKQIRRAAGRRREARAVKAAKTARNEAFWDFGADIPTDALPPPEQPADLPNAVD